MFQIYDFSNTTVIVFDTVDRTFEIVEQRKICEYVMKTGNKIQQNGNMYWYQHDMFLTDVMILKSNDRLFLYASSSGIGVDGFVYQDDSSCLVRILDKVYVRNQGIPDLKMFFRDREGTRPYIKCVMGDFDINVGDGVALPEMEHKGYLTTDIEKICTELKGSRNREYFYPYLPPDVRKRMLVSV